MNQIIKIETVNNTHVVSTKIVSEYLGIEHASLIRLINKHLSVIENMFGRVGFEIAPFETKGGVQNQKIAYLTEDQATFIGSLSKNSDKVVEFKASLVKAFSDAKKALTEIAAPKTEAEKLLEAFTILQNQVEDGKIRLELAQKTIQTQAPAVNFVNEVLTSVSCHNISVIAKELGMGAPTLNKRLNALGVQYKQGDQWLLFAKYQDRGFTKTKTHTSTGSDGRTITKVQTVWTEAGRKFIHGLINPFLLGAA